jgi:hypothetical protein
LDERFATASLPNERLLLRPTNPPKAERSKGSYSGRSKLRFPAKKERSVLAIAHLPLNDNHWEAIPPFTLANRWDSLHQCLWHIAGRPVTFVDCFDGLAARELPLNRARANSILRSNVKIFPCSIYTVSNYDKLSR